MRTLNSQVALNTDPTTVELTTEPQGDVAAASYFANVTAIGGATTWQISAQVLDDEGNVVTIAQGSASATGILAMALQAPFTDAAGSAVPRASRILYDRTSGTGTLTCTVNAVYGR